MSETSRYVRDLPAIYQGMENGFLGRYLRIFEAIWEPFEQRQSQITMYFDPRTSPAALLPMLEHWLAIPFSQHWPEFRRRQLLAEAADLYRWRGTNNALERVIAIYTGVPPMITAHPSEPFVIQIDPRVRIEQQADQEALVLLIELFKPAHIAYTILGSERP
jgi:phage tail-like protein